MNTRRNVAPRLAEEVANVGYSPHDERVPPHEENANVDQASVNPRPMMDTVMGSVMFYFNYFDVDTPDGKSLTIMTDKNEGPL